MSVSVPELVRQMLAEPTQADAPGGVVVGPASHTQQQQGVVVITEQGQPKPETDLPLARQRLALRCLAPSEEQAERIARAVREFIDGYRRRKEVTQPSSGETYLVHSLVVGGGPTLSRDSEITWESLLFLEALVGTEAVA